MLIAPGVEMLEISATVMGKVDTIHPTLLWDEDADTAILVDTGYPGQLPLIRQAMEKAGVVFEKLGKIIITHQDLDHIGSLPSILQQLSGKPRVLAHQVEKPYIQGERQLLKITPDAIAQAMASLPAEVPAEWRRAFQAVLENPPKAAVDRTFADGEVLADCGGLTVILTPGHTPGHTSLYHAASKTLIAGDAMFVADGQLMAPAREHAVDYDAALKSLKKLTRFDIEHVICYHGGLYQGENANRRIAELADRADS